LLTAHQGKHLKCLYMLLPKKGIQNLWDENTFIHFMLDIKTNPYIKKQRLLDGLKLI
jgi:hypothetical protein